MITASANSTRMVLTGNNVKRTAPIASNIQAVRAAGTSNPVNNA